MGKRRSEIGFGDSPWDAEYFDWLPRRGLVLDFGGGSIDYEPLAAAYREAAQVAKQMYGEAKETVAPWVGAGTTALGRIGSMLGLPGYGTVDPTTIIQATPGYQFALSQGMEGLERSAAARGMGLSGAQLRGLTDYAQNVALLRAYTPYMSNLQSLSQQGLGAGTFTGTAAMQTGQTVGADIIGAAQTSLAGQIAQQQQSQNWWSSLLGGIGSIAGLGLGLTGPMGLGLWGSSALGGAGAGASLGSGIGGAYGGYLGYGGLAPLYQEGGPAAPGQPYVIGEAGPELFVPREPGYVVPNHLLPYSSFGQVAPNYALGRTASALSNPAFRRALTDLALGKALFRWQRPAEGTKLASYERPLRRPFEVIDVEQEPLPSDVYYPPVLSPPAPEPKPRRESEGPPPQWRWLMLARQEP